MIKPLIAAFATLTLLPFSGDVIAKETTSSIYERFVFKKCPIIEQGERDSTHRCTMKKGPDLVFVYHEHGIITYLEPAYSEDKYGKDGFFQRADSGHFGELFTNKKGQTTVEWRVKRVKGKWKPFAAIYRTNYGDTNNQRQRLDVISFGDDHTCLVGSIETLEKSHNVRARELADEALETSACSVKAKEWVLSQIKWADETVRDAQKQGAEPWVGNVEAAVGGYESAMGYYKKTGQVSRQSDVQKSLDTARQLLAKLKNK